MKKIERYGKVIAMSAAALSMTAVLTLETSTAYFTTYVSAGGGGAVEMGTQTEIYEEPVIDLMKHIVVKNTSENDCFVRVKLFYAAPVTIDDIDVRTEEDAPGRWECGQADSNGYWYWNYSEVLRAGEETASLDVQIHIPEECKKDDYSFNVIVVQECVPAVYDEEGNAKPGADTWTQTYSSYPAGREEAGEEADN